MYDKYYILYIHISLISTVHVSHTKYMPSSSCIIALAYPNIEVQGANINENTGFKVQKCEPARLEQRFRPFNAGKWDMASFIY